MILFYWYIFWGEILYIYQVFCSPLSGHYVTVQCLDDWAFEVLKDVMWSLLLLSGCPCCSNLRSSRMNKALFMSLLFFAFVNTTCASYPLETWPDHNKTETRTSTKPNKFKTKNEQNLCLCLCCSLPLSTPRLCTSYPALATCPLRAEPRETVNFVIRYI